MAKQRQPQADDADAPLLLFSEDHLWVRVDADRAQVGLSDYGQKDLGKIIAAELPDIGDEIERGEPFGELESTRTVQELIAPVSGSVTAVNTEIEGNPELINEYPHNDGWLIEVELPGDSELGDLMASDEYDDYTADETERE